MVTWRIILSLWTFLIVSGVGVDKLIQHRHKAKLHDAMVRWWFRLDATRIPKYPQLLSLWISARFEYIFRRKPWRVSVVYVLLSFTFLWVAFYLSNAVLPRMPQGIIPVRFSDSSTGPQIVQSWNASLRPPHISVLLATFPFDFMVLALTFATLRKLTTTTPLRAALLISFYLIATCVLSVGCFASITCAQDFALNHRLIGLDHDRKELERRDIWLFNVSDVPGILVSNQPNTQKVTLTLNQYTPATISLARGAVVTKGASGSNFTQTRVLLSSNAVVVGFRFDYSYFEVFKEDFVLLANIIRGRPGIFAAHISTEFQDGANKGRWQHDVSGYLSWPCLLLTGTVALPAMGFMSMLMVMLIARLVLWAVMYVLERATEDEIAKFIPFTLLGVSLGIFVTLAKELLTVIGMIR